MREQDFFFNDPVQYPRPRPRGVIRFKRDVPPVGSEVSVKLTHLPAYTDVTIQVRVLNKYYVGPPSEIQTITTIEGGMFNSPFSIIHVYRKKRFFLNFGSTFICSIFSEIQKRFLHCLPAPGPPALFDVIARGSTHFELRWDTPYEENGDLIGYNISYQISELNNKDLLVPKSDLVVANKRV